MQRQTLFYSHIFLQAVILFFIFSGAAISNGAEWKTIETEHTNIYYQSLNNLEKFNDNVKYGSEQKGILQRLFGLDSDEIIKTVTKKVDDLFNRAKNILEMHRQMKKVNIYLYPDSDQLHLAYSKLYGKPSTVRAWYEYQSNSVYINAEDIHEGILAHELSHSIIDHYLIVSPPSASAEILARYVDSHLHDKSIHATNHDGHEDRQSAFSK